MGDRIPKNIALFGFSALQAAGFLMAAFVHDLPTAILFAVVFGAGFGGRVPLSTVIRGDYFGRAAFGKIMIFKKTEPVAAAAALAAQGEHRHSEDGGSGAAEVSATPN